MFAVGAVLSFTLLEGVLSKGFRAAMPQHHTHVQALATAMNLVSVLAGLGAARVVASTISHSSVWALAPFLGATVYLVLEGAETALAERVAADAGDGQARDLTS